MERHTLARWQSQRGRYWVELYADLQAGKSASFSYRADNGGGNIGHVAPEVAMQHAAQQAGFNPSKCQRVYFNADLANKLSGLT